VIGAYAWAHELSSGKDTPSGHWEIAGVPVLFDWGYFPIMKTASRRSCWINW
jgi:phosphopentomutase